MSINLTLIGQTIAFFLFAWICMRYVWPPLTAAMSERQQRIAEGLEQAERASKDLELAQQRATDELREAREQANEIIEQARKRATQMVEEAKEDARAEGERLKESARAEIDQEVNRARESLRSEVANLAVVGAERILESSVDRSKHSELLDRLAAEL